MADNEISMRVVISNEDALIALEAATHQANELLAESPWNDDLKEICDNLEYVREHLDCVEATEIAQCDGDEAWEELIEDDYEGGEEYDAELN